MSVKLRKPLLQLSEWTENARRRITVMSLWVSYLAIAFLAYLLCIHYIGVESMRYSDEVTHARVIQESIDSGAWFRLTLDGQPYYNKPPFKMWLTRCVVSICGEENLCYRLIDGIATFGTVITTALLAFRLFGSHLTAILSALLLLGSFDFLVESRNNQGTQEAMLLFLITTSMLVAWRLLRASLADDARTTSRSILLFSTLVGLSISTKSVAGAVPILIMIPVLAISLRKRTLAWVRGNWRAITLGGVIVAAVPGLYYGPLLWSDPNAWASVFHGEIYNRLLGEGYQNQARWWFYLEGLLERRPVFPLIALALGFLVGIAHIFYSRKQDNGGPFGFLPNYRSAWLFISLWIAIPLVMYSAFSSRVYHYIAPIFPALAVMAAEGVAWTTRVAFVYLAKRLRNRGLCARSSANGQIGWALATCCCLAVLFLSYLSIARGIRSTIALASTSGRKIDIEQIVTKISSSASENAPRVILFDMGTFLSGTGNQIWRFKFYLHGIRHLIRLEDSLEEVSSSISKPGPLWVIAPIQRSGEISALSTQCQIQPFVHPEGKRSHYRSHELRKGLGAPQFVALYCNL